MMSFLKLLISFWGYAIQTLLHARNILPKKCLASTPYEIWKGKKSDFSYFRVWGCPTHAKKHDKDKLECRTTLCRFVGYLRDIIRYYFYYLEEKSILVSKRVVFLKYLRRDIINTSPEEMVRVK